MSAAADAPRCAPTSAALGEPVAGTAPTATTWLVVEQPGPWGRQAIHESHLPAGLGAALDTRARGTGVSVLLARRPGHHADGHAATPQRAWLASARPGRTWLRRLDLPDPSALLELDLHAAGAGTAPVQGMPEHEPLLLVCTNSRRDRCRAIDGRVEALDAAARFPGRVWECSHLGGHRFAPTALVPPGGFVHGRLADGGAARVLAEAVAGRVDLATLRGRTCWTGPGQAAEADVRIAHDLRRTDDVVDVVVAGASASPEAVAPTDASGPTPAAAEHWSVDVVLADGSVRRRRVRARVDPSIERPESCVKPPVPLRWYAVEGSESDR